MNHNEAKQLWPRYEPRDINPLEAAALHHFNCKQKLGRSYREDAIDDVVSKEMPLQSEGNCDFDLMRRYVHVQCPYCGTDMGYNNSSASSGQTTTYYLCSECKAEATVTIVSCGGFTAQPRRKKR